MSPILVYFVRPGISYFLASRPSSYFVLLHIWYLVVSGILCFRIPCFLVSRTSWYFGILGISHFLVFRISWYRVLLGLPQILISRASWHLVLPDISHFMMSCMISCTSWYPNPCRCTLCGNLQGVRNEATNPYRWTLCGNLQGVPNDPH